MAWLAEHLAAQLEAIAREASAWSLREWDSAPPKIARWQRKRIQHQDLSGGYVRWLPNAEPAWRG